MKPYYQENKSGITIYHGDYREILPKLGQADLVLTDPPYNANDIGSNHRTYLIGNMKLPAGEYIAWCKEWFELLTAHPSPPATIVLTPGISNTHAYPQPKWQLCWHKPASVSFNRVGGYNAWEPIFVYGDTRHVCLGQDYLKYNVLNFSKGPEKEHPCPKPLSLWRVLAEKFSRPDALILDPFMGNGTTLRAAKDLHRKAIGIEIEEKYCEIAAQRLSQEVLSFSEDHESPKKNLKATKRTLFR